MFETFEDVITKIENEGLCYFILDYTRAETMPDDESKRLFKEAENALKNFELYINKKANEE